MIFPAAQKMKMDLIYLHHAQGACTVRAFRQLLPRSQRAFQVEHLSRELRNAMQKKKKPCTLNIFCYTASESRESLYIKSL